MNIFAANGVPDGEILAGQESEGLFEALGQINDLAVEHLAKAGTAIAALPKPLRPAFAPVALLRAQIQRIATSRAPFAPIADLADWQKIGMMSWWALRH
jgi:15-cis-phytoene synthase